MVISLFEWEKLSCFSRLLQRKDIWMSMVEIPLPPTINDNKDIIHLKDQYLNLITLYVKSDVIYHIKYYRSAK